jgi:hypothetical protein
LLERSKIAIMLERSGNTACRLHATLQEHGTMGRNEKTSKSIGTIASKGLRGLPLTKTEIKRLAGTALTQVADKPKGKGGRNR